MSEEAGRGEGAQRLAHMDKMAAAVKHGLEKKLKVEKQCIPLPMLVPCVCSFVSVEAVRYAAVVSYLVVCEHVQQLVSDVIEHRRCHGSTCSSAVRGYRGWYRQKRDEVENEENAQEVLDIHIDDD